MNTYISSGCQHKSNQLFKTFKNSYNNMFIKNDKYWMSEEFKQYAWFAIDLDRSKSLIIKWLTIEWIHPPKKF